MFDFYGPNALKVSAFIEAVKNQSDEDFSLTGPRVMDWNRLESLIKKTSSLGNVRVTERSQAVRAAFEAVINKGSELQRKLVAYVASMLVIEDHLTREERTFLSLFLVDTLVPLKTLYKDYEKEDHAIEDFCKQLSLIDGRNVYIKCRPDARGKTGTGLPDFVINRKGKDYTVEHTSINSYANQVHCEKLWAKYFKPLEIEEKVKAAYPQGFVDISIPIDALKSEAEARKFDFGKFVDELIKAVGKTPRGRNGDKAQRRWLPDVPFRVQISNNNGEGFVGCSVIQLVPTYRERMESDLEKEILRAINKKSGKLRRAKNSGEKTVLLLDSDDYALVNELTLADAFARAIAPNQGILQGVDEVYIQHRRGTCWIVPVKLGDRTFPKLPEFNRYRHRQWKLL